MTSKRLSRGMKLTVPEYMVEEAAAQRIRELEAEVKRLQGQLSGCQKLAKDKQTIRSAINKLRDVITEIEGELFA